MNQKRLVEFRRLAIPLVSILIYISVTYIPLAVSGIYFRRLPPELPQDERFTYISTLCDNIDIESRAFLHIYPDNRADRWNGDLDFNNYDFSFNREGIFFGESCAVIRNLPDYNIKRIRTGQFTANEGELWVEEFQPELLYQQRTSR